MPEGHTVHRLARELARTFGGDTVRASSPQGRFVDGAEALDGGTLRSTDAHGKHLFMRFQSAQPSVHWVHIHLGLYGKFKFGTGPAPEPRGALRLRLENDASYADLRGPTACTLVTPPEVEAIHERLGADPLRADADPGQAWRRISRSRAPIGGLLMDQQVVSGVGNVYRAEVLFRHEINPYRAGREVRDDEWDAVWTDLRVLLRAGVRAGRIVTTRPEDRLGRGRVTREQAHYVYGRADLPCRVCGTPVRREVLATRNLYWCPTCQPG